MVNRTYHKNGPKSFKIVSDLSEEDMAQLNALTEKLIVNCKELGAHGKRKNTKKCKHHSHEY